MLVISTDRFIPRRFAAYNYGPISLIRPKYKGTPLWGILLAHEKTHAKQFLRTFLLHPLLYKVSKKYRLKAEAEAYAASIRESMKHGLERAVASEAITALVTHYSLGITAEEAAQALRKAVGESGNT